MDETKLELSDAEWEYAWRYWEYLSLGEVKPSPAGFDTGRIFTINAELHRLFRQEQDELWGRKK